jgi:hypothetical protein
MALAILPMTRTRTTRTRTVKMRTWMPNDQYQRRQTLRRVALSGLSPYHGQWQRAVSAAPRQDTRQRRTDRNRRARSEVKESGEKNTALNQQFDTLLLENCENVAAIRPGRQFVLRGENNMEIFARAFEWQSSTRSDKRVPAPTAAKSRDEARQRRARDPTRRRGNPAGSRGRWAPTS